MPYPCGNRCTVDLCRGLRNLGYPRHYTADANIGQDLIDRGIRYENLLVPATPEPIQGGDETLAKSKSKDTRTAEAIKNRSARLEQLQNVISNLQPDVEPETCNALFKYALPRGISLLVNYMRKWPGYNNKCSVVTNRTTILDVSNLKALAPSAFGVPESWSPAKVSNVLGHRLHFGRCARCRGNLSWNYANLIHAGVVGIAVLQRGSEVGFFKDSTVICGPCARSTCPYCQRLPFKPDMTSVDLIRETEQADRAGFCTACKPTSRLLVERSGKRPVVLRSIVKK